jgi:hypothetical protein
MEECGICLEETTNIESFPCKHSFCQPCVKNHLLMSIKCPMCRQFIEDPEKAVEQCIMRTKALLTLLEHNFRKIASCELSLTPFNERTKDINDLWKVNADMAASLGLNKIIYRNNTLQIDDFVYGSSQLTFGNWITNLLDET